VFGPKSALSGLLSKLLWLGALLCFPGGALWALSPLGAYLSEMKYKSPDTFWKLFPSTVLLISVGLICHRLRGVGQNSRIGSIGFYTALFGAGLVTVGDVLKFYLQIDDTYLLAAPGWHTLRIGLFFFAVGSLLFAVGVSRSETLPRWVFLPFVFGTACGVLAVVRDLGYVGVALWVLFGAGWAWVGLFPVAELASRLWSRRRTKLEA